MQEPIAISTTPPLPGLLMVQQANAAIATVATNFAGDTDPAALASPFMVWANTSTGVVYRRNAAGTAWVEIGRVFERPFYQADLASGVLSTGYKNVLRNGRFLINQRQVSGTVTLAAGAFGHDCWKAGAGGCTYTFSTSAGVTTLTITAGTLVQTIEGNDLRTGPYTLSWSGTATGRIATGSFAASPVTASLTGGANANVEFGTGTLTLVQCETGSTASSFEYRPDGLELVRCQRYAFTLTNTSPASTPPICAVSYLTSATSAVGVFDYPVEMRASPTFSFLNGGAASLVVVGQGGGDIACTSFSTDRRGTKSCRITVVTPALAQGVGTTLHISTSPILLFSSDI